MASETKSAESILDGIGGAQNIKAVTHCATRLRFELKDSSKVDKAKLEDTPGVLGAVPQADNRYQVVIGAGVADMYSALMDLPAMENVGGGTVDDDESTADDIKAAERAKMKGNNPWMRGVNAVFEYLSNAFRPMIGILLGASLIIAAESIAQAFHVVTVGDTANPSWLFVESMWRSVFYFLPLIIAYNASKALKVEPWIGFTIMAALMTPEFAKILGAGAHAKSVTCWGIVVNGSCGGTEIFKNTVWGIPMFGTSGGYGGQVFLPLIMVPILMLVYRGLKRIIPSTYHMVFVPVLCMIIMIPVSAFILGPAALYIGAELGLFFKWINTVAPWLIALIVPMAYPFLVPLGLHWPLNALMLINIQTLGYDFIQGPMGTWNFACFGATAAVLALSIRDRDVKMRETALGALVAGLLGGISEPSLYGIHLRYKRAYFLMLSGCAAGGITIAVLGSLFSHPVLTRHSGVVNVHGVTTNAFAFTSLLTIPVFSPIWMYVVSIAVAFIVAFLAVYFFDYRTPEQKLAMAKSSAKVEAMEAQKIESRDAIHDIKEGLKGTSPASRDAIKESVELLREGSEQLNVDKDLPDVPISTSPTTEVQAPIAGQVISLDDSGDPVFATRALGEGVGIKDPQGSEIVSPITGTLISVADTGHAFGIKSDDGVEVLVHIGIDTVQMGGSAFAVQVKKGQRVAAGQLLDIVDFNKIHEAGHLDTVLVVVTNTKKFKKVEPILDLDVQPGEDIIDIEH